MIYILRTRVKLHYYSLTHNIYYTVKNFVLPEINISNQKNDLKTHLYKHTSSKLFLCIQKRLPLSALYLVYHI